MALTKFQQHVCRIIAQNRRAETGSYAAGGAILNTLLDAPRLSRDLDLFHDTTEALRISFEKDRALLQTKGYQIQTIRETPAYAEALVRSSEETVLLQWVRDSAYRFFPLVPDEIFGVVLHPFDLATNKVLALIGRLEIRDWIDIQTCSNHLQHLGLLAWASCGKDPGFSPAAILAEARRSSRYTAAELETLDFEGTAPDIARLSRNWKSMLEEAGEIIELLPEEEAGKCVLRKNGTLFNGTVAELSRDLKHDKLLFHEGSIGGVLPQLK